MKITVICSTNRKDVSSTYHLAKRAAEKLCGGDTPEYFFLPKDFSHFCIGCMQCIMGHHEKCAGYDALRPIRESMNQAQLIIFAVPVYVYHVPGQMKVFLDHFAWEWMVHQPNTLMFKKQALVISTAAGAGMKSTIKDVTDSLDYWGVGRVYTYKKAVAAANWTGVKPEKQQQMLADIDKLSDRILKDGRNIKTRIKIKLMFYGCRLMHKKLHINKPDVEYWKKHGWLDKERPWKNDYSCTQEERLNT